jgi:YbgC/YbaW family acyl-CoA thioester hydrolase
MTPISYTAEVSVRFADLDPYGHVNATNYLDYVVTARWAYAKERFDVTDKTFIERKVGFFMTRADQSFKRPIVGVQKVVASSFVREVADAKLWVPYTLKSLDGKTTFSEGTLEFMCIDLTTNKPTNMPDWVKPLFFEGA